MHPLSTVRVVNPAEVKVDPAVAGFQQAFDNLNKADFFRQDSVSKEPIKFSGGDILSEALWFDAGGVDLAEKINKGKLSDDFPRKKALTQLETSYNEAHNSFALIDEKLANLQQSSDSPINNGYEILKQISQANMHILEAKSAELSFNKKPEKGKTSSEQALNPFNQAKQEFEKLDNISSIFQEKFSEVNDEINRITKLKRN